MTDFLFVYQHKAREIESLCLLKLELERRGYSSELLCSFVPDRILHNYKMTKVAVPSALYEDGSLWFFVYDVVGPIDKVVNLQWEQVLSIQDESDLKCFHNPKGYAREAVHLCWGQASQRRITEGGVPLDRAIVTGAMHMDFLLAPFEDYFYTRNELAALCELNPDSRWILFISSFTMHNMTEDELSDLVKSYGEKIVEMKKVTARSKATVLEWIEAALVSDPSRTIIYRPHPDETSDESLIAMAKRYSNFRVIGQYSVKQWIKRADMVFTWFSTSAAEVQQAGKGFGILRPVHVPKAYDVSFYQGAHFIEDKVSFLSALQSENIGEPLDAKLLASYYECDEIYPAYMRVADVLEATLKSHELDMRSHPCAIVVVIGLVKKIIARYVRVLCIKALKKRATKLPVIGSSIGYKIATDERLARDLSKNQATDMEIAEICRKLRPIVEADLYSANKPKAVGANVW